MPPNVNIAGYKFIALDDLVALRADLQRLTKAERLRGSILLSTEGINLFLAGSRAGIDALLARVRSVAGLADFEVKESLSDEQPFNRMLVKIKREIIAFGVPGIEPERRPAPRVSAQQLKQWLDEQRPLTLLDTRNTYEVEAGTFKNAVVVGIDDFRDFPAAVARLPDELRRGPVVTFCTGGIRCEKAAPYLQTQGFDNVYQLDGGILKYFEECGGAHYDGQCFVFDRRVALDPVLQPGGLQQCFACQAILFPKDQTALEYVEGVSCPRCYQTGAQSLAALLAARQQAIARVTTPLPGSEPYDNLRPITVPARFDQLEVLDFFDAMRTHLARDEWRAACNEGRVTCRGEAIRPGRVVRSGERLLHHMPATLEPEVNAEITIVHEDEALVVINKPAPLPMHPCGRFHRNSLSHILEQVYRPLKLRPAHRLDADTSGVVVFSKTGPIARRVQPQFESGQVTKKYLARVQGTPSLALFECEAAIGTANGGIRVPDENGAAASTGFRLIEAFADGTSLVEAIPRTGRTNQIRVHLWHLGLPIVDDPIYLSGGRLGLPGTLALDGPRLCLHAASIELVHPVAGQGICYQASGPAWAARS